MVEIILGISLRWIHIVSAAAMIGGVLFFRFLLPPGLRLIDNPDQREAAFLKSRRLFKITVHSTLTLLIISGIYNTVRNCPVYTRDPALNHPIWGTHLLLALIAFSIALFALAGKKAPAAAGKWLTILFVTLLATVAAASTLKWAREKTMPHPPASLAMDETGQGR
jgi:uncharacterized membrane protein